MNHAKLLADFTIRYVALAQDEESFIACFKHKFETRSCLRDPLNNFYRLEALLGEVHHYTLIKNVFTARSLDLVKYKIVMCDGFVHHRQEKKIMAEVLRQCGESVEMERWFNPNLSWSVQEEGISVFGEIGT